MKMNKLIFVLIAFSTAFASIHLSADNAIKTTVLKCENRVDFMEKMESNNLFPGRINDIDVDNENNFYLLQKKYCSILKVDPNTGKLIKTISSKGQGPQELMQPITLKVKNGMIFVADGGFGGVKIFDSTNGNLIKAFKTNHTEINWLDVNRQNEIYVLESSGNPIISVYNTEGEKIRKALEIPLKKKNDRMEFWTNMNARFVLDSQDNVIALFGFLNKLRKFSKDGALLWERKIENKLLEEVPWEPPRYGEKGQLHCNAVAFDLDIDNEDNIIVGQVGGAAFYNKNGSMVELYEYDWNISFLKRCDNGKKLLILSGLGFRINIQTL